MELRLCENGHYYDASVMNVCPYCNAPTHALDAKNVDSWITQVPFLRGCSWTEFLASGSSGDVYKAEIRGSVCALKVIDCGCDPQKLRGAQYEIFLMKQLQHCKGLVHLLDSYILRAGSHSIAFLLEEYATPFETYYKTHNMTVADVLRLGIDLCTALERCWSAGVAHLDVQPKNLFVAQDGTFLLGDFGAGLPLDLLGKEQQLRGTLSYMAPEVKSSFAYSKASDLYSLGMVLYCLLNHGRLPLVDKYPKDIAVKRRLAGEKFAPPALSTDVLKDCIMPMLAFLPAMRQKDFLTVQKQLMTARSELPPQLLQQSVRQPPAAAAAAKKVSVGIFGKLFRGKTASLFRAETADQTSKDLFDVAPTGADRRNAPSAWINPMETSIPCPPPSSSCGNLFDADSFANTTVLAGSGYMPPPPPCASVSGGNLFDADSLARSYAMSMDESCGQVPPPPPCARQEGPIVPPPLPQTGSCTPPPPAPAYGYPPAAPSAPAYGYPPTVPYVPVTAAPAPKMSQVQFSAVAPKEARKGDYSIIQLFMYEQAFRQAVDDALAMAEGSVQEKRSGFHQVRENTQVKIVLSCPDMEIEDNSQTQVWCGGYLQFDFAICPPEDFRKRQLLITASVYFDDVPATKLILMIKPLASYEEEIELQRQDILTAFVSYASQDRIRVGALVMGMQKARPDMDIFFDVAKLHSGEDWEQALYREIDRRDILFLCWSRNAQQSPWVDREWRYALAQKGLDAIEPIPLEQPDVCPPPTELSRKHFNDSLLYIINR